MSKFLRMSSGLLDRGGIGLEDWSQRLGKRARYPGVEGLESGSNEVNGPSIFGCIMQSLSHDMLFNPIASCTLTAKEMKPSYALDRSNSVIACAISNYLPLKSDITTLSEIFL